MEQNSEKSKSVVRADKRIQQSKIFVSLLFVLVAFIIGWIIFKSSTQRIPTVISLEDKWNLLEASAHNLQGDSYLTNATIPVNGNTPYAIMAEYHSTSVSNKMIFVGIDNLNEIDTQWIDLPPSSSGAQKPINRNSWTIDSQDALLTFARDETVNACLRSSKDPIQMSLNRVMTESSSWVLSIINCPEEGKYKVYYLNAQTGEPIDPFNQ